MTAPRHSTAVTPEQHIPAPELPPASETLHRIRPAALRHLYYVVKAIRPKQWTKSGVVFVAFIFSVNLAWVPEKPSTWDDLLLRAAFAAVAFCLASGADYLINDLKDIEADRLHPKKRLRPIPAGLITPRQAVFWAVALFATSLAIATAVDLRVLAVVGCYIVLMLAYTFYLKQEVILDVMIIAAGFVLRAMAGAYAIDVPISPWLYVVAGLGALFLAVTKRRAEVMTLEASAQGHRATLRDYSPLLIDQMAAVATTSTVIAYALYTFTGENLPENHAMMLTIPFVAYGIFRYLFLSTSRNEGGHPEEVLLKDKPLMATLIGWAGSSALILTIWR